MSLACFILTMCCIGVNSGGFYKSGVLHSRSKDNRKVTQISHFFISRQFAHVVLTAIQWMKCLALFAAPALVSIFVSDETERVQWIWVFLILGACLIIVGPLIFCSDPLLFSDNHRIIFRVD